MSAPAPAVIRLGRERARTGPWRGEDDIALITPVPDAPFLSADFIQHCLRTLSDQGFTRVVTGALSPLEQAGFLAAGFDVEEHLRLLAIDLSDRAATRPARAADPPGAPLAPGRGAGGGPGRFHGVLAVRLTGLLDALSATPSVRFRMILGYRG